MLDLADLAKKAGRKQEAVQWLARAYDGAQGPATRFQWGYNYLVGLLEMTPEDIAGHRARRPVGASANSTTRPTRSTSARACGSSSWTPSCSNGAQAGEAAKVVETLRARTGEICRKLPEQDAGRQSCEKFLNPAA